MAHRIREAWADKQTPFAGPVEVDETFVGGKEANKHADKKMHMGRGPVGKAVVAGVLDRRTRTVTAWPIADVDKQSLHEFVRTTVADGAEIFTDEHRSYKGLKNHETVKHSLGHYVDGRVHTNGIESFWSMFKR
ncbi:MAG: IS1595 family transposase, partial [Candidatus Tectomicrobia bacterium]|nr:IS1595 family transposase [Candidatus Tectomicrobia bacterium]